MTDSERSDELLRLNEESRQNVFRLHRGEISDEVFVARMESIHAAARKLIGGWRPKSGPGPLVHPN